MFGRKDALGGKISSDTKGMAPNGMWAVEVLKIICFGSKIGLKSAARCDLPIVVPTCLPNA